MPLRRLVTGARRAVSDRLYAFGPGRYYRPAYTRLADTVRPEAGLVLDVGCGPGWLAAHIGAPSPRVRVLAIDRSPTMIGYATANARRFPNVDVRRMDAAALTLDDGTVDVAVAVQSAHWWGDVAAVLGEIHRVLRPGGRLYVYEADAEAVTVPIDWIERAGWWPPDGWVLANWRRFGMAGARWAALVGAVEAAGFHDVEDARQGFYRRVTGRR